jgi:hypothetical protein
MYKKTSNNSLNDLEKLKSEITKEARKKSQNYKVLPYGICSGNRQSYATSCHKCTYF